MEGIVLAGGFGTRLRQVVTDVPKPMAPIAGRPFLEVLLSSLAYKGFHRIILSLGYLADKISDHFGSTFAGLDLTYVVEKQPLGTGGGIRLAMEKVDSDHVFVFNGDTYLDLEVAKAQQQWEASKRPLIVALEVADAGRYGRILVTDGVVTGFSSKGEAGPGLINAGCYVLHKNQLDSFPSGVHFSIESDYLMPAVTARVFNVFITTGLFIDIGIPDDFLKAQTVLASTMPP